MNACVRPGTTRCNSLRCPSTIVASFLTRPGRRRCGRSTGLAREHEPRQEQRAAPEQPPAHAEQRDERHRTGERLYCPAHPSQLRADRGHDLVQVADDGVVAALAKIGASASSLIARIFLAPFAPAMCWVALLMPQAT